ncbi:MAG: 2-oxoacid:acceptor oxidoreductase subunit alpha [Pseudomonadota bacterium]|nr:2-oxoacid:acceptor oxidoreductase subunit alpha [Pseudomonadota bacterium]
MMDINLVIGGAAGQGLNTLETLMLPVLKEAGFHLFAAKDIMSRIRGGVNLVTIRVAGQEKSGYRQKSDVFIALSDEAFAWAENRLTLATILIGPATVLDKWREKWHKNRRYVLESKSPGAEPMPLNMVVSGLIAGFLRLDFSLLAEKNTLLFDAQGEARVAANQAALQAGYAQGKIIDGLEVERWSDAGEYSLMNGSQAVALGAVAGGCNFLSFYPMSPATGVAIYLAQRAGDFGLVVEQFEDEIAAAGASIGAWYAGARALVTTSGGGFALMEESISLAGMSETPMVLHLAQRPGPATGLPTRTMQGDLNLVLHAGHGEFPRVIFAPGTLAEAFYLTRKAFNLADKYQLPVFILTDQFFVDSYTCLPRLKADGIETTYHVVKTESDYRRYELTSSGVSPRGIPGHGNGVVIANGNEHDEFGDTTEDEQLSQRMPEKRMKKMEALAGESLAPGFGGHEEYKILLICWGSTYSTVREAVDVSGRDDLGLLHFSQLWPLPADLDSYFQKADRIIVVEENMTGQFAALLQQLFPGNRFESMLKYNGRHFYVEDIVEKLEAL